MKLINRTEELKVLEGYWKEGTSSHLVIIYGKRRVGKTTLIHGFAQGKPVIYFLADKTTERENLKQLGKRVGEFFQDPLLVKNGFHDWYEVFEYLKLHVKERIIFALDEFPYLVETNKAISSIFQKGWDETLKKLSVVMILCGSSIGMMEEETLSHRAPLYGRRSAQIFVKPFSFFDAWKFFPHLNFEEFLNVYSVAGGNPTYLLKLKEAKNLTEAIRQYIFRPMEFLFEEIEFLLKEELRELRQYMSILKAIVFGNRKFGEIVNETGMEKSSLHKYLFTLEDLHLIEKEIPSTEKNPHKSRKGLYQIQDQFVKFWFNFVYPFRSEIELGNLQGVIEQWRRSFGQMVAFNYEIIARDIVREHQKEFFPFSRVGRWWDRNEEIDLIGVNEHTNEILFGEVKWSTKPVGTNILADLKRKASLVAWGKPNRKEYFCLFSKSGFTDQMKHVAKEEKINLFKQDKIIRRA